MQQFINLLGRILTNGQKVTTRGLTTIELLNEKIVINPYEVLYSEHNVRPFEKIKAYLQAELAWYFEGSSDVKDIKKYAKMWEHISENGKANSNYGKLVFYDTVNGEPFSYFNWCFSQLVSDVNSRKAIILYNRPEYFYATKDFICTQTQQFFIRNGKLETTVYIRSSDAIRGLTFDIPWWSTVQQMLMHALKSYHYQDLRLGKMTVFIGSSHIYEEHQKLASDLVKSKDVAFYNLKLLKAPELEKSFVHYYETLLNQNFSII